MSNAEAPPESSAQREARAHLDWLADHDLDVHPGGLAGVEDAGLPRAGIEVTVALDAGTPWHASPSSGQRTFAQPVITIGRTAENDITMVGAGVSRRHATLRIEDRAVFITDHDTTNGIIIDGRRIQGEVILPPGQSATLGGWRLDVRLPGPWH